MTKQGKKQTWQIRRSLLISLLPKHNWSISKAAMELGYSKYYATNRLPDILSRDVSFCEAVEAKKKEIQEKTDIEVEEIVRQLREIVDDKQQPVSARLKGLELLGRYKAMFADRQIIEDTERRRELDDSERAEAQKLARIRLTNTG